jgi:Ca-activated chloride channel family protein
MKLFRLLAGISIALLASVTAQAQGVIIPGPCHRCPRPIPIPPEVRLPPTLKVKSIHFTTRISDQVATTKVEQVFENDTPYTLEGTYFFPLPESVSITEFAMWDGNKRLVGEVRSKAEARRIYDEIVRSRRDPALLEYAGKNLFQASVFPIAPHSDKKIELTYTQVLRNEGGTVAYRYPLGTGWRANRISDDQPQPVPLGARRVPSPRPTNTAPGRISAEIEIASRVAIKGVYSPSHEIEVRRTGEQRARVYFEARGATAQPDFQLFYTLSDQDFGLTLLVHREPGKDGYFMLRVSPKAELDERETSAKDVIFVLDTSGSMAEDGKMEKARAALRYGVSALGARDRFNIISFAGEEHLMSSRLMAANEEGKQEARQFIERMRAAGGTNINDALLAALNQLPSSERPRLLVLITDGQPTVGVTSANRILQNVKQANRANVRLFTFGVGYDINTQLLDGLAGENHGAVDYIEPNEDLEVKVSNFFAKVNYPVLGDIRIDWGGVEIDRVYPREIPDLFHGSQLVLIGRYRPARTKAAANLTSHWAGLGARVLAAFFVSPHLLWLPSSEAATVRSQRIMLTGQVNGRERRFIYDDIHFPETHLENEFLPPLWATRRVAYLLEQIRQSGESRELRDEIVDLGTRYGIVTPYTSYLVLEPGLQAQRLVGTERQQLSLDDAQRPNAPAASPRPSAGAAGVQQGQGRRAEAVTVAPPPNIPLAGEAAVRESKEQARRRDADKLTSAKDALSSTSHYLRTIAGKTFYLRDGVWTDGEFKPQSRLPEVKLTFASEAYFDLVAKEPKLADFFALGKRVIVVWKGKVYRIED